MLFVTRFCLPLLLLTTMVASATAQQRIVVTEFEYDHDGTLWSDVTEELLFRNDYELADSRAFVEEVDTFNMSLAEFLEDPGLVQEIALLFEVDAIVSGRLDRSRRARELILTVHEGVTGLSLGTVSVELSNERPNPESLDWGLAEVESYIAWTEPIGSREPEPREPEPREPEPRETTDPIDLVAGDEEEAVPWFWITAGMDITQRTFTIVAGDQSGIQYESGFYPGVEGSITIHPIAALAPGMADGLALKVRIARFFVETLLLNEDESVINIPTRHKEVGVSLGYNHLIGNLTFGGWLGYELLGYILGANEVYNSSEYSGFAAGVEACFWVFPGVFSIGGNAEVRPSLSLGEAELAAFGEGEALGYGFGADVSLYLFDVIELSGFYNYRHFSTDFAGGGTTELEGALESSDTFQYFGARLSYVY